MTALYVLFDPAYPNQVRYVGVTHDPAARLRSHRRRPQGTSHRENWCRLVVEQGRQVAMRVLVWFATDAEAYAVEDAVKDAYVRYGHPITNTAVGGRMSPMLVEETRRKVRVNMTRTVRRSECRERASANTRRQMARPGARDRISGENSATKRDEVRAKISAAKKRMYSDPAMRAMTGVAVKRAYRRPDALANLSRGVRESITPGTRRAISARVKAQWANSEIRAKMLQARHPNSVAA